LLAPLELLDDEELLAARTVGLALRLGYTLSAGVPVALAGSSLAFNANDVTLILAGEAAQRYGESVQRRLDSLAKAMGRKAVVKRP